MSKTQRAGVWDYVELTVEPTAKRTKQRFRVYLDDLDPETVTDYARETLGMAKSYEVAALRACVAAAIQRHRAEHEGPLIACPDPVCEAADRAAHPLGQGRHVGDDRALWEEEH